MLENPLVSVVIPIYGVEKYIARCAESLFTQTIVDSCEFIFVDDCSPDNSIEILKDIAKKYPVLNMKIISHKKNKGLAGARNTGLQFIQGTYFINVDSDDWVEPDYLESLVSEAERTNADITGCNLIYEFSSYSETIKNPLSYNTETAIRDLLQGKISGWLVLKLFRTSVFKENNLSWIQGLNMCEDLLIALKAFYHSKKISYIDKSLYHYNRANESSLSASLNENKVNQLLQVVAEIKKCLYQWNVFDVYQEDFLCLESRIKIWIVTCSDNLKNEYLSLYNDDCLYRNINIPLCIRLFHLFCHYHWFSLCRFAIRFKNSIKRKRGKK